MQNIPFEFDHNGEFQDSTTTKRLPSTTHEWNFDKNLHRIMNWTHFWRLDVGLDLKVDLEGGQEKYLVDNDGCMSH